VGAHGGCARLQKGPTQVSPLVFAFLLSTTTSNVSIITPCPQLQIEPPLHPIFEALFDEALEKYTKRTGQDLHNHESRNSQECSIDASLRIRSSLYSKRNPQAFDEFRHGDPKLIRLLTSIVNGLHAISTSAAISAGASLVSLIQYPIPLPMSFNSFP